ncbi:MAG: nuclear transport factor 2 family protein [Spirochaetaceae bacterium]|nr:nuclear transport factor 2 family protein [Myxococcales bacterium]MCB9726663.1 nuclear transport factor 2 family protein [Spirochaetaceae bacterium]
MQDVLDRLTRLEALVSIQQLMFRYAECVDLARFEALGELFRHGTIGAAGARPMRGVSEVARFYAATNRVHADGTLRTRHLAANPIVEIDPSGRRATARSYFVVLQETKAVPLQAIVAGRYHDAYHVVDDAWCFAERVIHVDQVGNMSDHLSFDLRRDPIPEIEG